AARAQHHWLRRFRRNDAAQNAARAEQGVAERQQRHDREIDALEAGGRALEVAVVDGEHHGAAGRRAEHARKPVLHAPIELVRALEEENGRGLRLIRVEPCTFGVSFWHEASRPVWLVGVYGVLLNRTTCRPAISVLHFRLGQSASGRSRPTGYLRAPTPRCRLYACARTCCRCPVLIHSRAPAAPATAVRRDAFGSLSQEGYAHVRPP